MSAGVGDPPLGGRHLREDDADVEAEEAVHPAHPLGVAAGQVVVDGHDVHAVAGQRVQVDRQRRDQRLALAGAHLGDVAHVQRGTAHDLDVEVPLAEGPSGRFPDCGERLRHQVVEALAARVTFLELIGLRPQLGVRQGFELRLDRVDLIGDRLERAKDLALASAHELVEDCGHEAWLLETVRDDSGTAGACGPSFRHRRRGAGQAEEACRRSVSAATYDPTHGPTPAAQLTSVELSSDEARRFALAAQHLVGAPERRAGVPGLLASLRAVQLDTISVLARSHELVAYARLGAVGRPKVDTAYWGGDAFEYWAHAACIMPLSQWPLFAFRRRHFLRRAKHWGEHSAAAAKAVLNEVRAQGPMTATDLGGAKKAAGWWGWSEVKSAAEFLLASGQLTCTHRVGWRRVYDLPERAIPADVLHDDLDDDQCKLALIRLAASSLGVATGSDLADYFRLKKLDVARLLPEAGLTPVQVRGWAKPAWAHPSTLEQGVPRGRHRTTMLSPFDSLVWDRARTARIFGLDHRLEAYVPKPLRQHGYFSMPVLAGGQLVARVDPARVNGTLIARQVTVIPEHATPARLSATAGAIHQALREAATWVGCDSVAIERVSPVEAWPGLR